MIRRVFQRIVVPRFSKPLLMTPFPSKILIGCGFSSGSKPTPARKAQRKVRQAVESEKAAAHLSFVHLNLDDSFREYLTKSEIYTPTPIQNMVMPEILHTTNNLFVGAQTGSGKTISYLIPIMQLLKTEEKRAGEEKLTMRNRPRAIVIVPSKELAEQVSYEAKKICHFCKLSILGLNTGREFSDERKMLELGVDLVVTTLARLQRHIAKENIFTSQVKFIVVDEADTILDTGNIDTMAFFMRIVANEAVIGERGAPARAIFVSATLNGTLDTFLKEIFDSSSVTLKRLIDEKAHLNLSHINHNFIQLTGYDKHKQFLELVGEVEADKKKNETAIVFCNSIGSCRSTEYLLKESGIRLD